MNGRMKMIANPTRPTATFSVSRRDLTGADTLLGSAEIARGVCRRADRTVSLLAITPERMRRIDGWFSDDGFVTHPVTPDDAEFVIGSVSARWYAADLIEAIVESLVGAPAAPTAPAAPAPVTFPAVTVLSPTTLPDGALWAVLFSLTTRSWTERRLVASTEAGMVAARVADPGGPFRTEPIDHDGVRELIARLADHDQHPVDRPDAPDHEEPSS